jgi:hypothetical protein
MTNKLPQKPMTMTAPTSKMEAQPATAEVTAPQPAPEPPKSAVSDAAALSDGDLNATLKVLRAEVRRRENERESLRPKVGSKVRILRGKAKFAGKIGTAVVVRKSRCFVAVPDIDSPAYLLITDVELVER